ncbi:bifunctional 2-polyprenyl-6-hydroxyphenol methylase/3-demethylubiquinol 3-O-methyltransferase UbiG [Jiangella sp. DSM 45060]|uniref:class I SAM-dependent methyltransferase n=1 Tax=Jiangella sp. DSM 45060 TaxID=1798224 RepID=UPI00087D1907|nr:class I SAM-dependent methyltransferase [Jiangella sp. DSM 45060]SDT22719.1 hypothetical protein SAMN04515669_3172 [Jiangella sp. DSM 45060]
MTETYERLAEFHDLFMAEPWERLRPYVRAAFAHLGSDAVVAEIGAGTGVGTRTIAGETRARIVALEPALVMRAVLTARVADDAALAERVTVVAGAAPGDLGLLPERLDGFVCAHVLGHLGRTDRRALFAWAGERLAGDGFGLVTTQRAETGPAEMVQTRRLGDHEYRVRHLAAAGGREPASLYEVRDGDRLVRSYRFASDWRVVTAQDVAADLPAALVLEPAGDGAALVRRAAA